MKLLKFTLESGRNPHLGVSKSAVLLKNTISIDCGYRVIQARICWPNWLTVQFKIDSRMDDWREGRMEQVWSCSNMVSKGFSPLMTADEESGWSFWMSSWNGLNPLVWKVFQELIHASNSATTQVETIFTAVRMEMPCMVLTLAEVLITYDLIPFLILSLSIPCQDSSSWSRMGYGWLIRRIWAATWLKH